MTNKLIKDIDEEIWRKFVAYCKIKGVKVGDEYCLIEFDGLQHFKYVEYFHQNYDNFEYQQEWHLFEWDNH